MSAELNRVRVARYRNRLKRQDSWSAPRESKGILVRLEDVIDLHQSNEDQVVDDLHDSLKAYCKVATANKALRRQFCHSQVLLPSREYNGSIAKLLSKMHRNLDARKNRKHDSGRSNSTGHPSHTWAEARGA